MNAAKYFANAFKVSALNEIFINKIQDSAAIGIDRVTTARFRGALAPELSLIQRKATCGTYKFTAYKQKLSSKGAESPPRVLSIPTVRDRVTLRALAEMLAKIFPEAIAEIPQTKIDRISTALESNEYSEYVKIDLHRFYPSVPHGYLMKALRRRIRKPEILSLIEKSITTATVSDKKGSKGAQPNTCGVPQGLAISNILAEILLLDFDKRMASLKEVSYERYIDDILILCKAGKSAEVLNDVREDLLSMGLKPHPADAEGSKTRKGRLTEEFDFLGYRCKDSRLGIRKQSVHKFESSLAGILTAYRHRLVRASSPADAVRARNVCEWRLNLRITGCIFEKRRLGWVFYFSQITDTTQLRAVDHTIRQLLDRFSLTSHVQIKRLLKVFYESQRSRKEDHRYIPNFDTMSTSEKRRILGLLVNQDISILPDARVNELFGRRIGEAVRELEEDLAALS